MTSTSPQTSMLAAFAATLTPRPRHATRRASSPGPAHAAAADDRWRLAAADDGRRDEKDVTFPLIVSSTGRSGAPFWFYPFLEHDPTRVVLDGQQPAAIRLLQLSSKGSWSAELDTGTRLELGRGALSEVLARTESFVRTLPQAVEARRARKSPTNCPGAS